MERDEAEKRSEHDVRSACQDVRELLAGIEADGYYISGADLSGLSIEDAANVMTLLVMLYQRVDAEMWIRFHEHPVTTIREADASLHEAEQRMRAFRKRRPCG